MTKTWPRWGDGDVVVSITVTTPTGPAMFAVAGLPILSQENVPGDRKSNICVVNNCGLSASIACPVLWKKTATPGLLTIACASWIDAVYIFVQAKSSWS